MKRIALLLLCFVAAFYASGQIIIVPMPHQEGYFSLDDVWRVNLISSQPQSVSVQLDVTIENGQHQMVLMATSPAFNLMQGSNRPSFNALGAKIQYGTGSATKVLRSTGRFPYGNYIVCYRVTVVENNAVLGEFCQEETVKPFSPPELISPYNSEEITTTLPILTWKPPFPPGATRFEYTLRLVEVKEKQDAVEALETNAPLVSRRGIFGTSLPYPGDAPKLEIGKTYAWQVSAKAGDFELGVTEVWVFNITRTPESVKDEDDSYRILNTIPDGTQYICHNGMLKFAYNNRLEDSELKYRVQVLNSTDKQPLNPPKIELSPGLNKINIKLSEFPNLVKGQKYILTVLNNGQSHQYLEFDYYE